MKKIFFLIFGHLSLALGIIGAFLPVLPTTPFLLLAAYFYSKSSPRLHNWIRGHKYLGPPLKDWQDSGVIGVKAKILAGVMITAVIVFRIPTLNIHIGIRIFAATVLGAVLAFVLTRPSKRPEEITETKSE